MINLLKLAAIECGEGWSLEVQTETGDFVGHIGWPWRKENGEYIKKTAQELESYGYEIQ